jgi:alkylation response protein AidB-like acyl-CoA dehydrogenase
MVIAEPTTSLLEAARTLIPLVEQYRDQGEAERTMPAPLVDAIREAGIFRMWVPQSLGGLEADYPAGLRVIEELSRQDGATGWTAMIGAGGGAFLAYIDPEEARALTGERASNIGAGALAPKGTAKAVEGGYRVTGRWPLGSGCMHSAWHCGGAVIMDGEAPRMGPDGIPDIHLMFWPANEGEIIDTWHSQGLRGTGSHDIAVNDIFVPEGRAASLFYGRSRQPGAYYSDTIITALSGQIGAVALGIARGAIDSLIELAQGGKVPAFGVVRLMDKPSTHAQVGRAEAFVRSARALFYETADAFWDTLTSGREISDEQRALGGLAVVNAVTACAQAVDLMHSAGGASSVYATSKLERAFRDIHTLTQHAAVSQNSYDVAGKYFLGLGYSRF